MTIGEDLKRIESEIRRLKIAYDLYFIGSSGRPPNDQRESIKQAILRYQGVRMRNAADRFLYNAILNRFNAFCELWNRGVRRKEEGERLHPLAARAAHEAAGTETGGTYRPGSGHLRTPGDRRRGGAPREDSHRIPVGRRDEASLRNLYQSYIAAKDSAGDRRKPSFDAFAREIARHAAALKGKGDCEAIDFKIYCKDRKVSIKAKPIR